MSLKHWLWLHRWSSLVCTLFLLLLCLTGLPLVFQEEIEHALQPAIDQSPGAEPLPLERLVALGQARAPGLVLRYLIWDHRVPGRIKLNFDQALDTPRGNSRIFTLDAYSGAQLHDDNALLEFILDLHTDLLAGLPGSLLLGFMGLLLAVSLVSGCVVYAPFMRRLGFAEMHRHRNARLRWLGWHNLLGIVSLVWLLVVGLTGVLNTLAIPLFQHWQSDQLAQLVAPYRGQPRVADPVPPGMALGVAAQALPGSQPEFLAMPGTFFSSPQHYAVFMRGRTPLTSEILQPVLVEARSGKLSAVAEPRWYIVALELSRPLHFGNYGGLPLKLIWAAFDIVAIVVLGSGVYLWLARQGGKRGLRGAGNLPPRLP